MSSFSADTPIASLLDLGDFGLLDVLDLLGCADFGLLGGRLCLFFLVFLDLVFRRGWDSWSCGDDTVFDTTTVPSLPNLIPASLGDDSLADDVLEDEETAGHKILRSIIFLGIELLLL